MKKLVSTRIYVGDDHVNLEGLKRLVLKDFANKVLVLYLENLFTIPAYDNCLWIYDEFAKRWSIDVDNVGEAVLKLYNKSDKIDEFASAHITDYLRNNYVGKDIIGLDADSVCKMCGGGEFPFLYIYLVNENGHNLVMYGLVR